MVENLKNTDAITELPAITEGHNNLWIIKKVIEKILWLQFVNQKKL